MLVSMLMKGVYVIECIMSIHINRYVHAHSNHRTGQKHSVINALVRRTFFRKNQFFDYSFVKLVRLI